MRRDHRKAAICAVIGYLIAVGFTCGMLRAAQKTRQMMYGGTPVLAQVTKKLPESEETSSYAFDLGGGEWQLVLPAGNFPENGASKLPPCTAVWIMRLKMLSGRLADQTAGWISGIG